QRRPQVGMDVGLEGRARREEASLLRKAPRQEADVRFAEDAANLLCDLWARRRSRRPPRGRARGPALRDRSARARIPRGERADANQTDAVGARHHLTRGQVRLREGDREAAAADERYASAHRSQGREDCNYTYDEI